jgi:hypothetical protein
MPVASTSPPTASATATKNRLAQATPEGEDELKERIRLAAQRAIAASAAGALTEHSSAANSVRAKKPDAPRQHTTVEPKIFVSPRPPDDPGLEGEPQSRAADADFELEAPRPSSAKA